MQNGEEHRAIELGSPRYCNDTSLWPRSRERTPNSNPKAKESGKQFSSENFHENITIKSDMKRDEMINEIVRERT